MKSHALIAAVITAISLSAYAADTSTSNTTSPDASTTITSDNTQTIKTLTTASNNGSAILPTTNTAQTTSSINTALTNDTDKVSYSMGYDIGRTFKKQDLSINPKVIAQGIQDGLSDNKSLMSQKEMQDTLVQFQKQLIAKHQSQLDQISQTNKKDGEDYLAANKTKPGVVTLADGLQYKVDKAGSGASPTDKDTVMVNYEGTFPNGQIFDSSYARGRPVTFPVNEVIQGWSEALKLMKPGAVWEIAVPSSLAYGERGIGPIGPNQTLLFKIELLSINPPAATTPAASGSANQKISATPVANTSTNTTPSSNGVTQ
jgi:FKBP-type peptidyl-prolyl cis-trans isomerase FklB